MKRYLSLIIIAATITFMPSCEKFLEENPKDSLPHDQAYNTESDLYINAVASLYSCVGGNVDSHGLQGTRRGIYDLNTFTTDEAMIPTRGTDWYDGGLWQALYLHTWTPGNTAIDDTWTYLFQTIIRCNESLEQIKLFEQKNNVNENAYTAEVRALRALFYFYAMDLYGRVPVFSSSSPSIQEMKLQPRSYTFNFIRSELLDVEPLLHLARSNQPGDYYSRITKPVVWFLIAKLALNAEIYNWDNWTTTAKPDGKNILWTINGKSMNSWEVVDYFCKRLTSVNYDLETYMTTNFEVDNEKSIENIFTIPMDKYLYTNVFTNLFRSRHYNHASALGLNGENGSCATIEALKAFEYDTPSIDPRFYFTYYAGEVYDYNGKPVTLDDGTPLIYYPWEVKLDLSGSPYEKTAGARMRKYDVDRTATKDGNQSNNDIVLFRYADALLMQAEALVRLNGQNQVSTQLVNKVRTRSFADELTVVTLDDILRERLLELAWEGWRRNDMIRFDTFNKPRTFTTGTAAESDHHTIVFPLPKEFLSLTDDTQNPGY